MSKMAEDTKALVWALKKSAAWHSNRAEEKEGSCKEAYEEESVILTDAARTIEDLHQANVTLVESVKRLEKAAETHKEIDRQIAGEGKFQ